jgi:two-component system cell cycle response regulator
MNGICEAEIDVRAGALHTDTMTLRIQPSIQCRVLVVDDDELVRERLMTLLKFAGYDALGASSATEALAILHTSRCQIMLTDWQMPGMDGLALCRAIRMNDDKSYVYVLMLTVRNSSKDVVAGLNAGADDYLVKGASTEEILARVAVGRRITQLEHSLRASNRENRRLSITDALTGAFNRRYLMKYLPRELERSRRHNRALALLCCDIDGFKRINDSFGHEAGDEVLKSFVARSTYCLRESTDWIARSGGEEFVVVLPETTLKGASCVADKLRQALASTSIPTPAGPLTVTVSIGVTAVETAEELAGVSVLELMRAADRCLYASKHMGRDRATAAIAIHIDATLAHLRLGGRNEIN